MRVKFQGKRYRSQPQLKQWFQRRDCRSLIFGQLGLPAEPASTTEDRKGVVFLAKAVDWFVKSINMLRGGAYEYRPYWIAPVSGGAPLDTRPRYATATTRT